MPAPEIITKAASAIRVTAGYFSITDGGVYQDDEHEMIRTNGLVRGLRGFAFINTGIRTGRVKVTIELWSARAPEPDLDPWEEVAEVPFVALSDRVRLPEWFSAPDATADRGPVDSELASLLISAQGPGIYRLRVHARGRNLASGQILDTSSEEYLVQAWLDKAAQDWPAERRNERLYKGVPDDIRRARREAEAARQEPQEVAEPTENDPEPVYASARPPFTISRNAAFRPPPHGFPTRTLAYGSAVIHTSYHQLLVVGHDQSGDWHGYPYSNGLISWTRDHAIIHLGIHTGVVWVSVEILDRSPGRPDTPQWDEVVEIPFEATRSDLRIQALIGEGGEELPLLTGEGPGHYRIRVHARGRDTCYDGVAFHPFEEYFVQVWPGDDDREILHNVSDVVGANARFGPEERPGFPRGIPVRVQ
jgi:hypothetical protein